MGRFQWPETAGSPPSPQPAWCSVRVQLVFQTDLLGIDLVCQAIELSSKNPNPTRGENVGSARRWASSKLRSEQAADEGFPLCCQETKLFSCRTCRTVMAQGGATWICACPTCEFGEGGAVGRSRKSAPGGDCWPGSAVKNWVVVRKLP